jgi:hypothetical protein
MLEWAGGNKNYHCGNLNPLERVMAFYKVLQVAAFPLRCAQFFKYLFGYLFVHIRLPRYITNGKVAGFGVMLNILYNGRRHTLTTKHAAPGLLICLNIYYFGTGL